MKKILLLMYLLTLSAFSGITSVTNSDSESIRDNRCIDKTFTVTSNTATSLSILDVNIEVNIDHTYRADLDITLTSPSGTAVDLSSDNGGSSDNLYVIFDDSASTSITTDNTTHSSVVERQPESALSAFNAEDALGIWNLEICDDARRDRGTYNYAVLEINATENTLESDLALNLYMDECYWTGGANGLTGDILDYSGNDLHATSRNRATNAELEFQVCRSGYFENTYTDQNESDAVYYPDGTTDVLDIAKNAPFSVSLWLYREAGTKWMAAAIKVSDDGWTDGWGIVHTSNAGDTIDFFVGNYATVARASVSTDTWTHIVGTYDGSTIRIYKNGVLADTQAQASYSPATLSISLGDDISGSAIDDRWQGYLDEAKVWHRTLSASEIQTIYNNENNALNYDGSTRTCEPCNGSDITANTWELIGIPAESRNVNLSVADVFSDDLNGTYGTDWILYKRTFSSVDNSSGYAVLGLNEQLEFGKGYWLGSKLDGRWYVDNTTSVDYNSTNSNCPAAACVEIPLRSVTLDGAVDDLVGSGPYRYNMNGFTGISQPVDWADCRFIVSDLDGSNEQVLTPSATEALGYASKQIWLYNPSNIDANSNGYTVCDDTSPGGCKLLPFNGFWVELHGSTKNKAIKLLIPEE
jgi:subtilisin-like proprotein convertase family protein